MKILLANREPSTHGPERQSKDVRFYVGFLGESLCSEMESPLARSACTALPSGRSRKSSEETGKSDLGAGHRLEEECYRALERGVVCGVPMDAVIKRRTRLVARPSSPLDFGAWVRPPDRAGADCRAVRLSGR